MIRKTKDDKELILTLIFSTKLHLITNIYDIIVFIFLRMTSKDEKSINQ